MKAISLFSGVGGFDLGFERAGFEIVAQVEKDAAARSVLKRHFSAPLYEDVKDVSKANLPAAHVIFGGFPCQDVSVAGKRRGLAGERSGLWFEFLRIVREIKPSWVVIENVPGLLSSNAGRDFAVIISGLEQCGYSVGWRVLDAQFFGVPQRRRRVFIVGHTRAAAIGKVLFERESVSGYFETRAKETETTPAIAGTLSTGNGYTGYGAGMGELNSITAHAIDVRNLRSNGRISGTLQAKNTGGYSLNSIATYRQLRTDQYKFASVDATLAARDYKSATDIIIQRRHVARRLTPVECERLQGFPDNWTAGQSDAARYRQMGNAVAVPVAQWLAERIGQNGP